MLGQHISTYIQGCSELVGKQEQPPDGANTHPKECCDPELSEFKAHQGLKLRLWPLSDIFRRHIETLSMQVRYLGAAKEKDVKFLQQRAERGRNSFLWHGGILGWSNLHHSIPSR